MGSSQAFSQDRADDSEESDANNENATEQEEPVEPETVRLKRRIMELETEVCCLHTEQSRIMELETEVRRYRRQAFASNVFAAGAFIAIASLLVARSHRT